MKLCKQEKYFLTNKIFLYRGKETLKILVLES